MGTRHYWPNASRGKAQRRAERIDSEGAATRRSAGRGLRFCSRLANRASWKNAKLDGSTHCDAHAGTRVNVPAAAAVVEGTRLRVTAPVVFAPMYEPVALVTV